MVTRGILGEQLGGTGRTNLQPAPVRACQPGQHGWTASAAVHLSLRGLSYLLKYIQAAMTKSTTVRIQREESLIPVFLAMGEY